MRVRISGTTLTGARLPETGNVVGEVGPMKLDLGLYKWWWLPR